MRTGCATAQSCGVAIFVILSGLLRLSGTAAESRNAAGLASRHPEPIERPTKYQSAPSFTNEIRRDVATLNSQFKFALRAQELRYLMESASLPERPVVVDVRPQSAFATCRIAGAINIPLSLIKTKGFYKNRQIVLVSAGHNDDALLEEALRLQAAGFRQVRVLTGGLAAWRSSSGQLVGEKPEDISWAIVSAAEIDELLSGPGWRIIDAGPSPNSAAGVVFTNRIHIPFHGSGADFLKALDVRRTPGTGPERILISEIPRSDFELILRATESSGDQGRYYFYLAGGAVAYGEFIAQQLRIHNRRPGTLGNQGLGDKAHHFESSSPGKSCCGGTR